jgi:hypothetical protein
MLPSITEELLDKTVDNLHTEGYEWNRHLTGMSQYEIDLDPEDYKLSCRLLSELSDYIDYLRGWF